MNVNRRASGHAWRKKPDLSSAIRVMTAGPEARDRQGVERGTSM